MFADIILPLPLDGYFTYSVPQQLQQQVKQGVRVRVPFGKSKHYVGLVASIHDTPPEGYQVKDIDQVLDASPILLPAQLKLWQWIADYYMSPIGEVYKAALPAGLKAEDGYRPKTDTYVRLTQPFRNERALHIALDMLQRAPKQLKLFSEFLFLFFGGEWNDSLNVECGVLNENTSSAETNLTPHSTFHTPRKTLTSYLTSISYFDMNEAPGSRWFISGLSRNSPLKPTGSPRPYHGSMHTNGACFW